MKTNKNNIITLRESKQLWVKTFRNIRIGIEYEPAFLGFGIFGEKRVISKSYQKDFSNVYNIILLLFIFEITLSKKAGKLNEFTKKEKGIKTKRTKDRRTNRR